MRCRKLEAIRVKLRADLERDDARVVAHGVVAPAAPNLPRLAFGQIGETGLIQTPPRQRALAPHNTWRGMRKPENWGIGAL